MIGRFWRRTVKRVKAARLGDALPVLHDRRIVNAGGRQEWHGHDHDDRPHSTLLFGEATTRSGYHLGPTSFQYSSERCTGVHVKKDREPALHARRVST